MRLSWNPLSKISFTHW